MGDQNGSVMEPDKPWTPHGQMELADRRPNGINGSREAGEAGKTNGFSGADEITFAPS